MRSQGVLLGVVLGIVLGIVICAVSDFGESGQASAGGCTQQTCLNPPCCNGDTNGDGQIDISDGVYIFNWLYLGGDPPDTIVRESGACEADVQGEWDIEIRYRPNTCGMPNPSGPVKVMVQQKGCALLVRSSINDEVVLEGQVCGNIANWYGTLPYLGFELEIESYMRLEPRGQVAHGVTTWRVLIPEAPCEGVEVWTAHRAP